MGCDTGLSLLFMTLQYYTSVLPSYAAVAAACLRLAGTGALAINLFADLMVQGNLVSCR